ncbi:MAG: Carbonic anhydrase/acetyltransferase, isoleucine patch superfamily [Candidatus Moranbacteria bacterium GW2011_GWF2_36_839]|nr:MAG: Carbonic anhydrase/acetyltransferase, isoleucine patch superfamily [Candidatus Moranbacteria bacterium GW2011_GWF1_36_78]KKQ16770.1 MAG: Carbonic anhydrase/acetyltransferase, isoleucine patch superfamily [Candidatus Moranbacteria bacterium GW2011_GWF2_36_839]HAT73576.1 hypothetical protein [Candidatus Moranbacteria bacterium]HBY10613.1 hypothetical protein [Candidatus Moranbacteria bacterium]
MQKIDNAIFGKPFIDEGAFVREGASIVGDVQIAGYVNIVTGAFIRGDECGPIFVGKGTNVQDGVTIHGLANEYVEIDGVQYSVWINSHCSLAHASLIHGPTSIDKKSFIGPQSQVWASMVGRNVFLGSQSLIKYSTVGSYSYIGDQAAVKGVIVPPGRFIADFQKVHDQETANNLPGVPDKFKEQAAKFNRDVVELNKHLVALYKAATRKRKR